ncbi:hypothetical protein ERJ75_000347100 [Trypanosoma vivax]|nr:hypothetical protein ERJ75_000347100 [Trypanosoma vivax]
MNTLQALAAAFVFSVVTVTGARGAANSAGLRLNDAQALCSASAVLKALGHAADTATKEALAAAGHAKLWHSTATRLAEETNNASVLSVAEAAARTLADTLALSDKAAKAREAATQQARRIDDIIEIFATYSGQADSTNGRLCIEKTSNNAQTAQAGDASVAAVVKHLDARWTQQRYQKWQLRYSRSKRSTIRSGQRRAGSKRHTERTGEATAKVYGQLAKQHADRRFD